MHSMVRGCRMRISSLQIHGAERRSKMIVMVICIGIMGLVLMAFDQWNDELRHENTELRERIRELEGRK